PTIGEECGSISTGDGVSDRFNVYCQEGWCDGMGLDAGTCQPDSALGGPCGTASDCMGDLRCIRANDTDTIGTCSNPGDAGTICSGDNDCGGSTHCGDEFTCVARVAN